MHQVRPKEEKSQDIQSVCLKENECLCCSCTTWILESRRLSLTLFITLWLESCSKFLAVFAAFADSPLSVCLCRKTSSCPNVQSTVGWTNVAGKRWNQTMNEQLKRSTSATHALAGALSFTFELQMRLSLSPAYYSGSRLGIVLRGTKPGSCDWGPPSRPVS